MNVHWRAFSIFPNEVSSETWSPSHQQPQTKIMHADDMCDMCDEYGHAQHGNPPPASYHGFLPGPRDKDVSRLPCASAHAHLVHAGLAGGGRRVGKHGGDRVDLSRHGESRTTVRRKPAVVFFPIVFFQRLSRNLCPSGHGSV